MKKRFLPSSLLLVILILGQSVMADQGGHYVPRTQTTMNAENFMGSLRANQKTGLIDPADMFKAMNAPTMRSGADSSLYWISMGPDNMGGQTTAVLYDNTLNASGNPNGVVYIGSKGGGVYKTYNYGVTWHQVGDMNLMVSTMVQDADGVIYVGTGDGGNNAVHNGLDQQNYDNSFIGTGIYAIDARNGDAMRQVVAPTAEEWLYVNELAIANGKLLAATPEGLKYSSDKGQTWETAVEGDAVAVKVAGDGMIVASIDKQVYVGMNVDNLESHSGTGSQMQGDTLLPSAAGLYDIAVAHDNDTMIYAANIDGSGNHKGIYVSYNKGENWTVVLPAVGNNVGHNVYDGYGLYNHGLVVDPSDNGTVYVLGHNLWRLKRPVDGTGYYMCECLTSNTVIYSPSYLHVGLHAMTFNPNKANEFYIGTDGGIYKGTTDFTFSNCNRNYITTRMFNVAYSGKDTRVLAAGLDHGTVLIEGDANANTLSTGLWINPTGDNMGVFSEASSAGPCAISGINPNTFFVTYKDGGLMRTETAGEDWVSTNFTSAISISNSSFRLPILLHENFEDELNPFTVWYKNEDSLAISAGEKVQCISNNNFPFNYTLDQPLAPGDSVEIHDPISSRLYLAFKDALYVTLTPLNFGTENAWYKLAGKQLVNFTGEPLSLGISSDGDVLFTGFKNGSLVRVANLRTVVDATSGTYTASALDSLGHNVTILNPDCFVETTVLNLPVSGQCVTSVSVDPRNANNVVVTCGNYGNEAYVFYSTNALAEEPTFVSVQGNLPKMPVYSSLIEMATGHVIIGTERGIYRTKNVASGQWLEDMTVMGKVPVMELKQQLLSHADEEVVNVTDEGTFVTEYPGIHNKGIIYAATYGRGVFRCENYKVTGDDVPETPAEPAVAVNVNIYPNPVCGQATVRFDAKENSDVSLQVFDLTGRLVMSQNVGRFAKGMHEVRISTENLSSGSYILRLNQGATSNCAKFLVY